ncbi:MAG TPA: anhydro-N-acetylmuramic acid kinase [Candidatus Dormibacteraeota bacterium]|nr:anhydro-N-acetylmuramic acid kinase [Candidatus Dormibacteraeota bacterium]
MLVLGLMSGTSADGIDVALARIDGAPPRLRASLENFLTVPYPAPVRRQILRIAEGASVSAADIGRMNFLLGALFGDAALAACRRFRVAPARIDLVGSHGQTIYHQGRPSRFLGRKVASTLQIGEPAEIAARTGIATIADFRPADVAAGGQGAPLVPFVDFLLYRDARLGRVALNIGGIANITVIPRAAQPRDAIAFDTGPGNMVIDALVSRTTNGRLAYDRGARIATRGHAIPRLLDRLLADSYFRQAPPKSAGREQFGRSYLERLLRLAGNARPEDVIATATLLTPLSILDGLGRFVFPRTRIDEVIVSGGGAHNPLILAQLETGLGNRRLLRAEQLGVGEDAKEAFAFAVLAYETWHRRPANLPAATGARYPAILGKVAYPPRGTR